MLDRPDDAIKMLQRQSQLGFLSHAWRVWLEDEPIFDRVEARKEFQALMAECRPSRLGNANYSFACARKDAFPIAARRAEASVGEVRCTLGWFRV